MKKGKRFLALILLVVTVVSVMTITASAANTTDSTFASAFTAYESKSIGCREKTDTSPVYFEYNAGPSSVRVIVYGRKTYSGTGYNVTLSNDQPASYVTCIKGTDYSVHTQVYEKGYSWAAVWVWNYLKYSGTISGLWSPDSRLAHVDAVT